MGNLIGGIQQLRAKKKKRKTRNWEKKNENEVTWAICRGGNQQLGAKSFLVKVIHSRAPATTENKETLSTNTNVNTNTNTLTNNNTDNIKLAYIASFLSGKCDSLFAKATFGRTA